MTICSEVNCRSGGGGRGNSAPLVVVKVLTFILRLQEPQRKKREYKRRKHKAQPNGHVQMPSSLLQQYNDMDIFYRAPVSSEEEGFSAVSQAFFKKIFILLAGELVSHVHL